MAPQFHESESDGPSGGHGASGDGRRIPRRRWSWPAVDFAPRPGDDGAYRRVPCRRKRGPLNLDAAGPELMTCAKKRGKQHRRLHVELTVGPFSKQASHALRARLGRRFRFALAPNSQSRSA
jgi:hypothetical protein